MDWEQHKSYWPHASSSQFIATKHVRWHAQIMGQGPALITLHGAGSSGHSWRDILPALAEHYTVINVDLPGHAFSQSNSGWTPSIDAVSRALNDLLQTLGVTPMALLGHSAGATVAAQWVLDYGNSLESSPVVMALNPAWLPMPGIENWLFPISAKLIALNPFSALWMSRAISKTQVIQRLLESTGSTIPADGAIYYAQLLANPAHVRGVLAMMAAWDLRPMPQRLMQIKCPIYIHAASNDRIILASQSAQSLRYMPHAQLSTMQGVGHLSHEEAPQKIWEQIKIWMADINKKARSTG